MVIAVSPMKAPSMTISPCAKLMSSVALRVSAKPNPTKLYTQPIVRPPKTSCTKVTQSMDEVSL